MKKKIFLFIHIFIFIIMASIIAGSFFVKNEFPMVSIEELYFYARNGVANSDTNVFVSAITYSLPLFLLLMVLFYTIFYDITFNRYRIVYQTKKRKRRKHAERKKYQIYPFVIIQKHRIIFTILLVIISVVIGLANINCIDFIKNINSKSEFIETNYVNPENAKIKFTEKRNLIMIFLESFETSMFTKKQGGSWDYEVIPEMYDILKDKDTTVFYDKKTGEEMKMVEGASWTTASLVTNTSGLPFKIPINGNEYHSENFMNGAYTLGDLLKKNGYNNEVISAARASFGGISDYYTKHGNYTILDPDNMSSFDITIPEKERNDWGFSDKLLFETAKTRITELADEDKPFNMHLISIDTHFYDGIIYDYSVDEYDSQYENAFATSSKTIYNFIEWVKKQDFYKDTTIVIVGDHLSMESNYFLMYGAIDRYIYNCYINPAVKAKNTKNREYTALDTYPSTVAAIGGEITGDKLGLGINLFSNRSTLTEKYGFSEVNKEVQKKSQFYNNKILGKDYKTMLKVKKEKQKEKEENKKKEKKKE